MLPAVRQGSFRTIRLLLPLVLAFHGVTLVGWVILLFMNGPTESDWSHLKRVADHFVAGDWSNLYTIGPGELHPEVYWRYPPFALYLVAPLAALSQAQAYLLLAGMGVVALGAAVAGLGRLLDMRGVREEWILSIVCSAPAITTLITGQSSGWITLCVVVSALWWTGGRPRLACGVLGLLCVKPNWGVFFGLYALVRGEWRGAATMVAVVAALCATALPLGGEMWAAFLQASTANDAILAVYEPFKLITLRSFLDAILPSAFIARLAWAAASLALVWAAVQIWRVPAVPIEHLGATLLLAVATNPYASFYDGLVLIVPASVWWTQRARWRHGAWRFVGLLISLAWIWEHAIWTWGMWLEDWFGIPRPSFSLIGPVTAVWLVVWATQAQSRLGPVGDEEMMSGQLASAGR